ncbi:unnamed protein product [Amoebophrya sp. A25]|nr:unnamed protein product [Amoebophrya sp. A25]|eukprot:GSA25T00022193001.1
MTKLKMRHRMAAPKPRPPTLSSTWRLLLLGQLHVVSSLQLSKTVSTSSTSSSASTTSSRRIAPVSGSPFLVNAPLQAMPTEALDDEDTEMMVSRERYYARNAKGPEACTSIGQNPLKEDCLSVEGRDCMWVSLQSGGIRNAKSYCMACDIDRQEVPCWNKGATVSGDVVEECEMRCPHQKQIRQPEYACIDESGFLTQAQCFELGTASNSRCMYLSYEGGDGAPASACAPCEVAGTGTWDCPATGSEGKLGKLVGCDSMCAAPPPPPPPGVVPPPPPPENPGLRGTSLKQASAEHAMIDAPFPVAPPDPPSPQEIVAAAEAAKAAAALASGTTPAPPLPFYEPVVMYRTPADYMANMPLP